MKFIYFNRLHNNNNNNNNNNEFIAAFHFTWLFIYNTKN